MLELILLGGRADNYYISGNTLLLTHDPEAKTCFGGNHFSRHCVVELDRRTNADMKTEALSQPPEPWAKW